MGPGSPLGTAGNLMRMLAALAAGTTVSATVGTVSLRLGGVTLACHWITLPVALGLIQSTPSPL